MTSRWMVCGFLLLLACSEDGDMTGSGGVAGTGGERGQGGIDAGIYADKDFWLCRPDIENDHCDAADLATTKIYADETRAEVAGPAVNPGAAFDCFAVHSTGNDIEEPGNVETIVPASAAVVERILRQVARFRGSCRIFAPAYHMMTIGTYQQLGWDESEYFQRAYDDVAEAFEYYMRNHNDGRDIVLIGASQGAHLLTRLLEEKFDEDERLRGQLISAVLMGIRLLMYVPIGELVGGNLANIPLCSSETKTGCVIAYEPWADLSDTGQKITIPPGTADACVNPASLDNANFEATMASFWYNRGWAGDAYPDDVTTEWISMPGVLTSQCVGSRLVLRVVDGDSRADPNVPLDNADRNGNLHGWLAHSAMDNLIEVVQHQASTR